MICKKEPSIWEESFFASETKESSKLVLSIEMFENPMNMFLEIFEALFFKKLHSCMVKL